MFEMNNRSSLFSLSKLSISELLIFREKKCENQIKNAKYIAKLSNPEDIFTEDFKQKMKRNQICLGAKTHSDNPTHFPVYLNEPFISNENKKSSFATVATKKENHHLNQINNSTFSGQRFKINTIFEKKDTDHLIFEMNHKSRFTRKKLTDTKVIWNSIQENIKNIVSSSE
ncbi:uncharacterized protein ELE39_001983 [Cryptosporidium sp. chipmunk genotype I]|uniref:uncharacterized protein n=1 Tax=Cryptosporidium sp. chipmunk genotype I TaxID=1280935 RepID=UPI003519DC58|nr:hypothetical protein ELE39_001983 [Cryptosporidium sp. chipmunk genotype I]